jgi:pimeloyl-ACP methyl ester carboxylesterase/DNA-binding CsgD family transcriptional regulator
MGDGPPLVMVPGWLCHLEQSWTHPAAASAREKFAAAHRFIWYDRLGCGLSDREGFELSLENDLEQLFAVLDAARVERASLIGYSFGGPPAALFAARYPQRVHRLVFYSAFARGTALTSAEGLDALKHLTRTDWALGSRALASMLLPNASSQDLRWFSRFQRAAATAEMATRLLDHLWSMDVRTDLPDVGVPTLVLHNRGDKAVPLDAGRELATLVPGARLEVLDGNEHDPFIRDSGSVVELVLDFVDDRSRPRAPRADRPVAELTPREREVLALLAGGRSNKAIATRLSISVPTVERHITHIYSKLGTHGRADAAVRAVALGLVTPPTVQ